RVHQPLTGGREVAVRLHGPANARGLARDPADPVPTHADHRGFAPLTRPKRRARAPRTPWSEEGPRQTVERARPRNPSPPLDQPPSPPPVGRDRASVTACFAAKPRRTPRGESGLAVTRRPLAFRWPWAGPRVWLAAPGLRRAASCVWPEPGAPPDRGSRPRGSRCR